MKKYVALIDTSESSPENKLYVSFHDTKKAAIAEIESLNLHFKTGYIYCAIVGKRIENDRYKDDVRTDDGLCWRKQEPRDDHAFVPTGWSRISDWANLSYYQKSE